MRRGDSTDRLEYHQRRKVDLECVKLEGSTERLKYHQHWKVDLECAKLEGYRNMVLLSTTVAVSKI